MDILLVEDEDAIAEPLMQNLAHEGHEVRRAATGAAALTSVPPWPDIILLDLRLPDTDGFDVCRRIREQSTTVPIIIVSARGEEIDKVLGLELGADDYLVKPFGFRELLARMSAVTRRAAGTPIPTEGSPVEVHVGAIRIDQRAHRVFLNDAELDLTPTEFALLERLSREPGAALSRDVLLRDVWNTAWSSSGKTIDVHIAALRRKLGDPGWIESVRGVGYRLIERA